MKIRWDPDARQELREAVRFLNERQHGLGGQFRQRVNEAVERIRNDPTSYERVEQNIHRCNVKRFAYSMFYQAKPDNNIVVFAIVHNSRRFGYWKHRIQTDEAQE